MPRLIGHAPDLTHHQVLLIACSLLKNIDIVIIDPFLCHQDPLLAFDDEITTLIIGTLSPLNLLFSGQGRQVAPGTPHHHRDPRNGNFGVFFFLNDGLGFILFHDKMFRGDIYRKYTGICQISEHGLTGQDVLDDTFLINNVGTIDKHLPKLDADEFITFEGNLDNGFFFNDPGKTVCQEIIITLFLDCRNIILLKILFQKPKDGFFVIHFYYFG